MRHILYFDGTWRKYSDDTNVSCLFGISKKSANQSVWYDAGIGTSSNIFVRVWQGSFGIGMNKNILDGYKYLVDNWNEGDDIIFVGFSRGAYTARSLAGLIAHSGIVRNRDAVGGAWDSYRNRKDYDIQCTSRKATIKMVGVFDTVGSLGLPDFSFDDKYYSFHDTEIHPSIEFAYQALSLDEMCPDFPACIWTKASEGTTCEQRWFSGSHGDVGGGYKDDQLSDGPLLWMASKLISVGVELDLDAIEAIQKRYDPVKAKLHQGYWDFGMGFYGLFRLGRKLYRQVGKGVCESVDPSVAMRIANGYKTKAKGLPSKF